MFKRINNRSIVLLLCHFKWASIGIIDSIRLLNLYYSLLIKSFDLWIYLDATTLFIDHFWQGISFSLVTTRLYDTLMRHIFLYIMCCRNIPISSISLLLFKNCQSCFVADCTNSHTSLYNVDVEAKCLRFEDSCRNSWSSGVFQLNTSTIIYNMVRKTVFHCKIQVRWHEDRIIYV